jgi:hypothetical protein
VLERTILLRYAIKSLRGNKLQVKNRRKSKKVNLLELSDVEKIKIIRAIKENLRQKAVEAKLWQSFVEADDLTINGRKIQCSQISLKGISIGDLTKNM